MEYLLTRALVLILTTVVQLHLPRKPSSNEKDRSASSNEYCNCRLFTDLVISEVKINRAKRMEFLSLAERLQVHNIKSQNL